MTASKTWKAVLNKGTWQVLSEDGTLIATIAGGEEAGPNARLLAASPAIRDALKVMVQLIGDEDLPDRGGLSGGEVCDMARAALEPCE